jgi:hypothetical protein
MTRATGLRRRKASGSERGARAKRLGEAKVELAQLLENHIVDSAPDHRGDVYGHLLADAIEHMDWEAVAESLLRRVAARAAA